MLDGHRGGETPDPIPNSEVKLVSVSYCTIVRKPMGSGRSCQASSFLFVHKGEGKAVEKHTSVDFIGFLDEMDSITDPEKEIHIIADRYSAHRS